jgi:hypothetical protein
MKISGFTIEAWSILRRVKVLSDAPLGQSGPTSWLDSGHPGRAHITCHPLRQTIILENLHHSFNALAHTSLPSPGLAPELFSWRMPAGLRLANCVMAITKKRFSLPNRAKRTAHS